MADRMRMTRGVAIAAAIALSFQVAAGQTTPPSTANHPAVGSWFGEAMQLCVTGAVASACAGGNPAITLYMTPTLNADGGFLGNDSLAVGTAPFGPHTTAHGTWVATSATEFTADYVFMQNTFPPVPDTVQGIRFRWAGQVVSSDTINGFVNLYFAPPLPVTWKRLLDGEFPVLPAQSNILVTSPTGFVRDPNLCRTLGCPLVFKFTIKRVRP